MLTEKVRLARKEVKAAQSLILQSELKARRRVLRRLGYVDSDGVVTVKGRAAAEIQSADELVLTELMFGGVFKVTLYAVFAAPGSTWLSRLAHGSPGSTQAGAIAPVLRSPSWQLPWCYTWRS